MKNQVEREVLLPVPPVRVWEALSDPDQLSAWFGADASMDLRPGGRARFRWPDGTERTAVVETAEEPRLLVFRWLPFERLDHGEARLTGVGRVRIALEPHEAGSLLSVVESGAPTGGVESLGLGVRAAIPVFQERPLPSPEIRAGTR
jgi:uncharacterized protein YndB with AHSA1/START domain